MCFVFFRSCRRRRRSNWIGAKMGVGNLRRFTLRICLRCCLRDRCSWVNFSSFFRRGGLIVGVGVVQVIFLAREEEIWITVTFLAVSFGLFI